HRSHARLVQPGTSHRLVREASGNIAMRSLMVALVVVVLLVTGSAQDLAAQPTGTQTLIAQATQLLANGRAAEDRGDPRGALMSFQQALDLFRRAGERSGESVALNNIGGAYYRGGQLGLALQFYQQALPIKREVRDRKGEEITLYNIGLVYHDLR